MNKHSKNPTYWLIFFLFIGKSQCMHIYDLKQRTDIDAIVWKTFFIYFAFLLQKDVFEGY